MARFVVEPCKTEAAFEAIPERPLRLDLGAVGARLTAAGFRILADARVLLMVRGACDASVFPSGRVLLKTRDRAIAERVASDIVGVLDAEEAAP